MAAYKALLQGRFYDLRETDTDTGKAIESYTQATQLDPRYALAWSGLSPAWTRIAALYFEGAPAHEAYAKARDAANRARSLSPELALAHIARGSQ